MVEKKPKDTVPISDVKKNEPPAKPEDPRVGRMVEFFLVSGFHFAGVFLGETEIHYQIFESREKKNMDVRKESVERAVWEGEN